MRVCGKVSAICRCGFQRVVPESPVPSFHHVDHRNQTQVVRTDVGSLFLLSHHLLPTPFLEGAFLRKAVERALLRLPMSENSYFGLRMATEV